MHKDVEDIFLNNVPDVSKSLERMNDILTKSTNEIIKQINIESLESIHKSMSNTLKTFYSYMNEIYIKAFNMSDISKIFESSLKSFSERLESLSILVQSDSIIVLSEENTEKVNETINKAVSVLPIDKDNSTNLSETPLSKSIQKQHFWTLENINKLLTILLNLLYIISLLRSIKEDQNNKIEINQTININYYTDDIQKDNKAELQDIQEEVEEAIQQIIENIEDNTQETTDDASTLDFPSEEY